MRDKLIEIYLSKKIEAVDYSIINNVGIDNIIATMNEVYKYDWTYEIVETKEFYGELFVNITLYIPGRVFTCVTMINLKDDNYSSCIDAALYKAFKNMYSLPSYDSSTIEMSDKTISDSTSIPTNAVEEINLDDIDEDNNSSGVSNKVRKDQIDYMNNFKKKYNIDSDLKFNYYVRTWSDNSEYNIETKVELVSAGEKAIDSFINWIELVTKNNGIDDLKVLSPI